MILFLCMSLLAWADEPPVVEPSDQGVPVVTDAVQASAQVDASFVLEVTDRELARQALIGAATDAGGYFSESSDNQVVLRLPNGSVDGIFARGAELGTVVDRSFESRDLGASIADVGARLDVRRQMLDRYYAVLAEAEADAVIAVEQQIVSLVEEIEGLTGQLRYMEHQTAYARVVVWFSFQDRAAPAWDGDSSFAWLNTVDLTDVVYRSVRGYKVASKGRVLDVDPPEGFAVYRYKQELRAVSPDGVVFRMRSVKHEPKAELGFWQEAMRRRMEAAGYHVVSDEQVSVGPHSGVQLFLAAPMGTLDYGFLVTVVPLGSKLVVIEVAGEISVLETRRDAIDAAITEPR